MIKATDFSLHLLGEHDQEFYHQIYSDESLMQFVTTPLTRIESIKSFKLTLERMSQPVPKLVLFVIKENETKEKMGVVGLRWNQNSSSTVEIGIVLKEKFHGTGCAHCTKKILINHAFTNLSVKKIIATCEKNNKAANKANEKLGFMQIGEYLDEERNTIKIKWELNK